MAGAGINPHPGLLAPASLKLMQRGVQPTDGGHSSGAACPGLIEAWRWTPWRNNRRGTHPGLLAPASLKLVPNRSLNGQAGISSGAACPGLIEAAEHPHIVAEESASSGAACPGLIEAKSSVCFSSGFSTHPGLLAPASLKPAKTLVLVAFRTCSSGAACPGLIEARTQPYPSRTRTSLIRGCLPRPH